MGVCWADGSHSIMAPRAALSAIQRTTSTIIQWCSQCGVDGVRKQSVLMVFLFFNHRLFMNVGECRLLAGHSWTYTIVSRGNSRIPGCAQRRRMAQWVEADVRTHSLQDLSDCACMPYGLHVGWPESHSEWNIDIRMTRRRRLAALQLIWPTGTRTRQIFTWITMRTCYV